VRARRGRCLSCRRRRLLCAGFLRALRGRLFAARLLSARHRENLGYRRSFLIVCHTPDPSVACRPTRSEISCVWIRRRPTKMLHQREESKCSGRIGRTRGGLVTFFTSSRLFYRKSLICQWFFDPTVDQKRTSSSSNQPKFEIRPSIHDSNYLPIRDESRRATDTCARIPCLSNKWPTHPFGFARTCSLC
jgi:hypothetical protein